MTARKKTELGSCPLFHGLSGEEMESALAYFHAREKKFQKGESLKHPGTALPFFGFVLSGNVEVYMDDIEGNHLVMAYAEEGDTFGESLCYLGRPNPVGIMAMTDCCLLLMDCRNLHSCGTVSGAPGSSALNPVLVNRFIAMLAGRTLSMNSRIQTLSRLTIRDKLNAFFFQQQTAADGKIFEIPMDREHLAAYLGVNRSALSRELSRMKEEGLIDYYRNSFRILR